MTQDTEVVPRISLMVPESSLARDRWRICRAMLTILSKVMLPLCLMFFCFFRSRGGSLRALMMRAEAEGTTSIWACRFWMVSFTVIRSPFQAQGADLGVQGRRGADLAAGAPQVYDFDLVGIELGWHGGGAWCRMNPDSGRPKRVAPTMFLNVLKL
uniref:Uncharacterized protein n=1 Tax=Oryctolagus cuniculus TaxID=9986 RepID=A0A5F9CCX4_RABIT